VGGDVELTSEELKIRRLFKNGEMQGSEKIQDARCSRLHKRPGFFQLTQQIAVLGQRQKR
jgi:hypothetical protein